MSYDIYNTFSSVSTIEQYEQINEQILSLQTQITSLKRDLEYLLYNIDTQNLSKRLQQAIATTDEEE